MRKIYFLFLFLFLLTNAQENTSLNLKTLHQVNNFNGGEVFKTVFDDDQNNVTVGYANGKFSFGDENLSTTNTNTLFVFKSDNQTGQKIWVKTFAPSSKGSIKPYLVYSKNNQTYIVFNFKGSVTINGSTYNSNDKNWVVMKMDENGNVLWSNSVEPMNLKKYFDVKIQNGNAFFLINNKIFRFNDVTGELISSFYNSDFTLTSLEVKDQNLYFAGNCNKNINIGSESLKKGSFIIQLDLEFNVTSSLQFYGNEISSDRPSLVVDLELLTDGSLSFVGLSSKKIKAYGENGIVADCNYNMTQEQPNLFAGRTSFDFTNIHWLAGNYISPYFDNLVNIKIFQLPNQSFHLYFSLTNGTSTSQINFFNTYYTENITGSILLQYNENGQPTGAYNNYYGTRDSEFDFKLTNNKAFLSEAGNTKTSVYEVKSAYHFENNFTKNVISKKSIISSNAFRAIIDGSLFNDVTIKSELSNYFGTGISTPFSDLYSRIISKVAANGNLEWSAGFAGINEIDSDLYYWKNSSSISQNGETTVINKCSFNNDCYVYSNNAYELLSGSKGKTFITNFTSLGSVNWMKTISGSVDSYSVYENKGASYVTFHTYQSFKIDDVSYTVTDYTIVIIKISPLGQVEFVKLFQNNFYLLIPVILSFDENDNIYVFIETYLNGLNQYRFGDVVITSNSQNSDYLMLKLDANGTPVLGKNFYENLPDNFSSGWLSDVEYNGTDFVVYGTTGGNVSYFGLDGQIHTIPIDFLNAPAFNFISKVSKEGIVNWETAIFSKTFNYSKISLDNSANIYVHGFWTDKININNKNYSLTPNTISNNILKLNTLGDFKYIKEINSVPTIDINLNKTAFTNLEISALPNGKIVIAGNTTSNNLLNGDINNLNGDNYYIAILEEEVLKTEEVNKININIYPNPTSDFINITTKEKINNIEVYDATGRKVISEVNFHNHIDVRKLLKGVYYIRVNTDEKSLTTKFIKN